MKTFLQSGSKILSALLALASAGFLVTGCATKTPKPGVYNIEVNLDPALKGQSVVIDLVGVNSASLSGWEAYPMSAYWKDGDHRRMDFAEDRVTFSFVTGDSLTQTLPVTDPHWKTWNAKRASHVLVLAHLSPRADKPGDADDRRRKLPLDKNYWAKGTKTINVLVKQSGIQVPTPTRQ